MFDDVLEVRQAFTSLIDGGMPRSAQIINRVDHIPPSDLSENCFHECDETTHSFKSLATHDVSSHDNLAITSARSLGTMIGVVS